MIYFLFTADLLWFTFFIYWFIIADLLLCYKILHGYVVGPPERYGLLLRCNSSKTRGHSLKVYTTHSRVTSRLNFFGNRIVKPWNFLPKSVALATNIKCFNRLVKNVNWLNLMNSLPIEKQYVSIFVVFNWCILSCF